MLIHHCLILLSLLSVKCEPFPPRLQALEDLNRVRTQSRESAFTTKYWTKLLSAVDMVSPIPANQVSIPVARAYRSGNRERLENPFPRSVLFRRIECKSARSRRIGANCRLTSLAANRSIFDVVDIDHNFSGDSLNVKPYHNSSCLPISLSSAVRMQMKGALIFNHKHDNMEELNNPVKLRRLFSAQILLSTCQTHFVFEGQNTIIAALNEG